MCVSSWFDSFNFEFLPSKSNLHVVYHCFSGGPLFFFFYWFVILWKRVCSIWLCSVSCTVQDLKGYICWLLFTVPSLFGCMAFQLLIMISSTTESINIVYTAEKKSPMDWDNKSGNIVLVTGIYCWKACD